jgi:hypothetical protein
MNRKDVFPDFFILGAAKCGTSSLHAWLDQHSHILMSDPKEPFFFEAQYSKGLDFYWKMYYRHWNGEKIVGDARHRNLYFSYIPERIHRVNPNAKFIVLMRNPIERALSHYWTFFCHKDEKLTFKNAIMADYERIQKGLNISVPDEIRQYEEDFCHLGFYRTYLDTGYYAEQIECYLQYFSMDSFKIFLFEDLVKDPNAVVWECCEFLGLDTKECDDFDYWLQNEAKPLKLKLNHNFLKHLKHLSTNFLYNHAGKELGYRLANIRKKPQIDPELRKWLAEHFRLHNKKLEEMTGQNLGHWV